MKQLGNLVAILGILLFIYAVVGRFLGGAATIGMGIIQLRAASGLVMANSLMLIAVLIKLSEK